MIRERNRLFQKGPEMILICRTAIRTDSGRAPLITCGSGTNEHAIGAPLGSSSGSNVLGVGAAEGAAAAPRDDGPAMAVGRDRGLEPVDGRGRNLNSIRRPLVAAGAADP